MSKNKMKQLSAEELYAFSDEMEMMISSGVSSIQGITLMMDESAGGEEKALLVAMEEMVAATGSLARAVEDAGVFPPYFVDMVRMGEQTGNLDSVLKSLSKHYAREIAISSAIKSAVGYPLLMVGMMLVIIIVLITEIMPIFERVFLQLGSTMDGISGGLLAVGTFLNKYGFVFLGLLILIVIYCIYIAKNKKARAKLIASLYKRRTFRNIYDKIATSRFASAMAMTLASGMDIMQAIDMSGKIVDAPGFEEKLEACKDAFAMNMDIGKAFSESGIFSGLYGRMAILGAKTGNMESVLEKVANTYQEEADNEINELIAIVEPTLIIVLSIIVGLILLSVILPLLNIMSGMI